MGVALAESLDAMGLVDDEIVQYQIQLGLRRIDLQQMVQESQKVAAALAVSDFIDKAPLQWVIIPISPLWCFHRFVGEVAAT